MSPSSLLFVASQKQLSVIARGIFLHYGFLLQERRTVEEASALLEREWLPDWLVVDLRIADERRTRTELAALYDLIDRHRVRRDLPTKVVLITATPLGAHDAARCETLGIGVPWTWNPPYRHIAQILMHVNSLLPAGQP